MRIYVIYTLLFFQLLCLSCKQEVRPVKIEQSTPELFPDYSEVTIPTSIAPLNFTVRADFTRIDAVIEGNSSGMIHIQGKSEIKIPSKEWKAILSENVGSSLDVTVSIKTPEGWIKYAPFKIYVSPHPIDEHLVYRLIAPGYEVYSTMGIYQRDLSSFNQHTLIENTILPGNCINCHSFQAGDPQKMSLHIRGQHGGTVLATNGTTNMYETKTDETQLATVYPYWHPSGKYIAYSVNQTQQAFHTAIDKRVEVVDLQSDLVIYNVETNELYSNPLIKSDEAFETYPAFSSDGRSLFFCSATPRELPGEFDQIQYNLCRIDFKDDGTFGAMVDTLFSATAWNKSASFPRPSYDGRFLIFTVADYGNFPIWHKGADIWMIDLRTGDVRELAEVNSDAVESYHSWSTNSRWFVFSSRRLDGLYTRPFIASVDEAGNVGKPFLLPQRDAQFYDRSIVSYNIPEFVTAPVALDAAEIERLARSGKRTNFTYRK